MNAGAKRVIFSFRDQKFAVEAAIDVQVRVPPSEAIDREPGGAPFYFELQDEAGEVLYRRRRPHPSGSFVEVPTGDASRPFVHAARTGEARGAFSILVPASREGSFVALFGTSDGLADRAPVLLGRFDLRSVNRSLTPPPGIEPTESE